MDEAQREPTVEEEVGGATRHKQAGTKPLHPLVELTLTRLREFIREPEVVFWVFVFPVLLACALGIAFRNTAPEKLRIGVESSDAGGESARAIADLLAHSSDIEPVVLSPAEAAQALRSGKVVLVVRAAAAAATDESQTASSLSRSFDYRYDPTRPESRTARLAVDDALERALGRADLAQAHDVKITEQGARYIDFLIPGLVGMNLMGSGMWGLGFVIVNARGRKLLKRFAATPMRRSHYLLSFIFSRLLFMVLEVGVVIGFAWVIFGVAVHGSLLAVLVIAMIGAFTFAGLGLLVAARPQTIEGVSGLMNFVMLPMWLLSGIFFSSSRFPQFLQPFIKALPLTALNDSLRAVINDGAPLLSTWAQLGVMAAWCLISFTLALRTFRWQ
ncbi:MAG TPA: ABC transporter permease [Pyrinomonadaceae bacterium]|jgi:ABC-type multidrug transport system permease subunit